MTIRTSLFPLLLVGLVGAGCAKTPVTEPYALTPPTPQVETNTQPDAVLSETIPTDAMTASTEPVTPTDTSTASSMNTSTARAFPGILPAEETKGKFIHLNTTKGEIVFELLPNEGPKAASNFVYLAKQKFYDGLTFHRVVPDFVIQGGDPEGSGMGGPGYAFEDDPVKLPYTEGMVAMANAGPNTNGSQFFIMLKDTPLPPSYSIFGRVVQGLDVVHKIGVGDVMTTVTVEATK